MSSSIFKKLRSELKKFYSVPENKRRQQKPPVIPLPSSVLTKIRSHLLKEFNGKCAYCESPISNVYHGDFDHFRPKSSARGMKDEFSLSHYWTLAFDWRNMYLCCEVCNRYKVNWFPVEGKRAALTNTFLQIQKLEKTLLIDPCHENPSLHIGYTENGMMLPLSEKGGITIDILKLNRKDLVEKRRHAYAEMAVLIKRVIRAKKNPLKELTVHDKNAISTFSELVAEITRPGCPHEFLGIQLYFLAKSLKQNDILVNVLIQSGNKSIVNNLSKIGITIYTMRGKIFKPEEKNVRVVKKAPAVLIKRLSIESIEIENFKSIENLVIKFPEAQKRREPWLMLLGENGVGKSSFLQAVTLALMGEKYRSKINIHPREILRSSATKGFVKINQPGAKPIELHFNKTIIHNTISTAPCYLLSYGSTRLFPSKSIKPERTTGKIRAKNMFSPEVGLFADAWLISLYENDKKKFDFAARALKALLSKELEDPGVKFDIKGKDVIIRYSDKKRPPDRFTSLSDGYKSIIALACDMMHALMQGNSTMEVAEGIVLIDEVGTHLHPRWKMRIVNSLRNAFPRLQFIVTTHDPLCLKGLGGGEVAIFDKNEDGKVFAITDLPDPGEFRAEQLLASKFFGLSSTIDVELEKDFNDYYELLSKQDDLNAKGKKKLEKLKEKLRDKKHLGNSLREELAFTAADKLLSNEKNLEMATPINVLKEQTVTMLQGLWDKPYEEKEQAIKA